MEGTAASIQLPPMDDIPVPDILLELPYLHPDRPRGASAMIDAAGAKARLRGCRPGAWLVSPKTDWHWAVWPDGNIGWLPMSVVMPPELQVSPRNDASADVVPDRNGDEANGQSGEMIEADASGRSPLTDDAHLPPRPPNFEFRVGYGRDLPDQALPKSMVPRDPIFLTHVEWSWSSMHDVPTATISRDGKSGGCCGSRVGMKTMASGIGSLLRASAEKASANLRQARTSSWNTGDLKVASSGDFDHYHEVVEEGLVTEPELEAIARNVW